MGIALLTLSSLSTPLRALSRWLHHPASFKEQSAESAQPSSSPPDSGRGGRYSAGSKVQHRPAGFNGQRPLRGNWPFTVTPPTAPADERAQTPCTSRRMLGSSVPSTGYCAAGTAFRTEDGPSHCPTKVVRRTSACGAGRLVIAGRMADVCAELDRMVASEAALQAY